MLGYYIAMLEQDVRGHGSVRGATQETRRASSAAARAVAGRGSHRHSFGARGRWRGKRSTRPKDSATTKSRPPTNRRPRCGRRSRETSRRPGSARSRHWDVERTRRRRMLAASRLALAGDIARRSRWPTISSASIRAIRSSDSPTCRHCARWSRSARNQPAMAIELLQANVPYERAIPATAFNFFFGSLYPVYVRGQAYAASGQHQQAVAEFQKILDHPGLMMGDPASARARLEKARSLALAGDRRPLAGVPGLLDAVGERRRRCAGSGAGEGGARETSGTIRTFGRVSVHL